MTQGELAEIADDGFRPLNVMVLVRKPNVPDRPSESIGRRLFGNPDEAFLQSKPKQGLLTPAEVRAMALAEMDLGPASIGLGHRRRQRVGVDRGGPDRRRRHDLRHRNGSPKIMRSSRPTPRRFGVANLVAVLGTCARAPGPLADPDSMFVGGTGREISRIVELAFERLRPGGRLVANVASIENLAASTKRCGSTVPAT